MYLIFFSKTFYQIIFMLIYSFNKITCYTNIECPVFFIR
jgi:hypothetical protein